MVLDDVADLPDGLEVKVEPVEIKAGPVSDGKDEPILDAEGLTLGQKLMKHAGKAVGLPSDLAANHDCWHRRPKTSGECRDTNRI